jgi:aldose 1-epimerase
MKVCQSEFGQVACGQSARLFTFYSAKGMVVKMTNYSGIITSIQTPDKAGKLEEICAGFDQLADYLAPHPYFGAIVGRYANRIAHGKFSLNDQEYSLSINNGAHHLHGGFKGFHTKLWEYRLENHAQTAELKLFYQSAAGEEGYPGNLDAMVTYTISDENEIIITFQAITDQPTAVNLTHHGYYHLNGFRGDIGDHLLRIAADAYLPVDSSGIPSGEMLPVAATEFDFSRPTVLANRINAIPGGIDHCFVLRQPCTLDVLAAELIHEKSGRCLQVFCTQPGIQIYTGNFLDGSLCGHHGIRYRKHQAICLETQHFPDSPNHPHFPSTWLFPGQTYFQQTRLLFSIG